MTHANEVEEFCEQHGGWWGEYPAAPTRDWIYEVGERNTRLGYWEWAYNIATEGAQT
jgi:hypothetical protein